MTWTDETLDIGRRMKRRGRSFFDISLKTGIEEADVARRFGRSKPKGANWTDEQVDHLSQNLHKSDEDLAVEISAIGPTRSKEAVKTKRRDLTARPRVVRVPDDCGWPSMRGTDEDRDAKFVRMVWAEALRLGLGRREAA